jgi:hypothetical protein
LTGLEKYANIIVRTFIRLSTPSLAWGQITKKGGKEKMKNLWLGILVMIMALGMAVIGCENGFTIDPDLEGRWISDSKMENIEIIFINGNFERLSIIDGGSSQSDFDNDVYFNCDFIFDLAGTYTTVDNIINFKPNKIKGTVFYNDKKYSPKEDDKIKSTPWCKLNQIKNETEKVLNDLGMSNEKISEMMDLNFMYFDVFEKVFIPSKWKYSVNGNTLTWYHDYGELTLTRKN